MKIPFIGDIFGKPDDEPECRTVHPSERQMLKEILGRLRAIQEKGDKIMAILETIQRQVAEIDAETDRVAAVVAAQTGAIAVLQAQIAAGTPATAEQLQAISDSLTPEVTKLQVIGKPVA